MEIIETEAQKKQSTTLYFIICLIIVFIDQLTKLIIHGFTFAGIHFPGIEYGSQIPVIGTFLQITYIENPGMAFGIHFQGTGKLFLSIFSIIASVLIGWYLSKIKDAHLMIKIAVTLILAGAVGNLIDRVFYGVIFGYAPLFYGRVIDFIQVDIPDIHIGNLNWASWPIFNVADSCVTVGIIILLLFYNKIPSFSQVFAKPQTTEISQDIINVEEEEKKK
ncbi:MAG TPA: signal peptidase II [Candidatus Kapabacteria bacterium]|nr:signal peptidase II [Candidatus Kapabacteria bacterium]